jgi:hypothetical protein
MSHEYQLNQYFGMAHGLAKRTIVRGIKPENKERPCLIVSDSNMLDYGKFGTKITYCPLYTSPSNEMDIPIFQISNTDMSSSWISFINPGNIKTITLSDAIEFHTSIYSVCPDEVFDLFVRSSRAIIASDEEEYEKVKEDIKEYKLKFMKNHEISYIRFPYARGTDRILYADGRDVFAEGEKTQVQTICFVDGALSSASAACKRNLHNREIMKLPKPQEPMPVKNESNKERVTTSQSPVSKKKKNRHVKRRKDKPGTYQETKNLLTKDPILSDLKFTPEEEALLHMRPTQYTKPYPISEGEINETVYSSEDEAISKIEIPEEIAPKKNEVDEEVKQIRSEFGPFPKKGVRVSVVATQQLINFMKVFARETDPVILSKVFELKDEKSLKARHLRVKEELLRRGRENDIVDWDIV